MGLAKGDPLGIAGGRPDIASRAERDTIHTNAIRVNLRDTFACAWIPKPNLATAISRSKRAAIRRRGQTRDFAGSLPTEHPDQPAGASFPKTDPAVLKAGGSEHGPIRG